MKRTDAEWAEMLQRGEAWEAQGEPFHGMGVHSGYERFGKWWTEQVASLGRRGTDFAIATVNGKRVHLITTALYDKISRKRDSEVLREIWFRRDRKSLEGWQGEEEDRRASEYDTLNYRSS